MALALGHRHHVVGVGAYFLYLIQGGAGGHELEGPAVDVLQRFAAQRQTEAVHRHHGQSLVADLKQGAGVDGTGLIDGNSKAGLVDHGLQRPLLQCDGELVVHLRQLRIVVGAEAGKLEAGIAAVQLHVELVVCLKGHHIIRQAADHLAEQSGVQHDVPCLGHCGLYRGAYAGLHIIAGQPQSLAALQQDTLQRRDGAFSRHRPRHCGHRLLYKCLFTGKFHHIRRSSLSESHCRLRCLKDQPYAKKRFCFSKSNHKLIFYFSSLISREILCGHPCLSRAVIGFFIDIPLWKIRRVSHSCMCDADVTQIFHVDYTGNGENLALSFSLPQHPCFFTFCC